MEDFFHPTPLLDSIEFPKDLRNLTLKALSQVAEELRQETIAIVSKTGGHLGASLGVVELTVALHYLFDTPTDRLIWDVGHQAYPHKILTGRRKDMRALRQSQGPSGFTRRLESVFDPFGAAHSSTSISAGLGMSVGRDLLGKNNQVIAVIGDGALSAGMAYEAMNNAGALKSRLIVILNDNDMSIAPPVGAMSGYLSRILTSQPFHSLRRLAKDVSHHFPKRVENFARRAEEYARGLLTGGSLFEELGFFYTGPIDGHNLEHLIPVLKNVRDRKDSGPFLIHVITQKGRGHPLAETAPDKVHFTSKFDIKSGVPHVTQSSTLTYTKVFADSLIEQAKKDEKIVAVTAAMPSGTGLDLFAKIYPDRCFDVGIAEQHAVTFCGGLACEGLKPFAAIYSTFLQRGYDQIVHDIALQSLPVRFAIDRAGLVGADGATHAGSFDLAYLGCLPNFVIMAAADEVDLKHMVATQVQIDDRPSALRYPRGEGLGLKLPDQGISLEIGKGRFLKEGNKVAILSLGARLHQALLAAEELEKRDLRTTVVDARFLKPLDEALILQLARHHEVLITLEEGSVGGFSSHVLHFLSHQGMLDKGLKIRPMILPDTFIDHDTLENQYKTAGLMSQNIVSTVLRTLGVPHKLA